MILILRWLAIWQPLLRGQDILYVADHAAGLDEEFVELLVVLIALGGVSAEFL